MELDRSTSALSNLGGIGMHHWCFLLHFSCCCPVLSLESCTRVWQSSPNAGTAWKIGTLWLVVAFHSSKWASWGLIICVADHKYICTHDPFLYTLHEYCWSKTSMHSLTSYLSYSKSLAHTCSHSLWKDFLVAVCNQNSASKDRQRKTLLLYSPHTLYRNQVARQSYFQSI